MRLRYLDSQSNLLLTRYSCFRHNCTLASTYVSLVVQHLLAQNPDQEMHDGTNRTEMSPFHSYSVGQRQLPPTRKCKAHIFGQKKRTQMHSVAEQVIGFRDSWGRDTFACTTHKIINTKLTVPLRDGWGGTGLQTAPHRLPSPRTEQR